MPAPCLPCRCRRSRQCLAATLGHSYPILSFSTGEAATIGDRSSASAIAKLGRMRQLVARTADLPEREESRLAQVGVVTIHGVVDLLHNAITGLLLQEIQSSSAFVLFGTL